MIFLVLFGKQQKRQQAKGHLPLVDMNLLACGRFTLGVVLVLLIYSTSSSFFLCFALLMQSGLGLNPLAAGSIFAPCSVGFVIASLAAPRLVARWGTNAIVAGAFIYAISTGLLVLQINVAGGGLNPARLIPVLIAVGAGQGFIMTPLLNLLLGYVPQEQAGMASGVISTVQQVGAAVGVAAVGVLFSCVLSAKNGVSSGAEQYVQAFVAAMIYNATAAVLVCILLLIMARWSGFKSEKRK